MLIAGDESRAYTAEVRHRRLGLSRELSPAKAGFGCLAVVLTAWEKGFVSQLDLLE